jgi:hypothetical protein
MVECSNYIVFVNAETNKMYVFIIVTVYGKTQPKSFWSMFMCFINLYHVSNILCNTVSQAFCELLHFEMLVLENLEKSDF